MQGKDNQSSKCPKPARADAVKRRRPELRSRVWHRLISAWQPGEFVVINVVRH